MRYFQIMNNNSKKISFSFSKTRKPSLAKKIGVSKEAIEFVNSFDYEENKSKPVKPKQLIIPLVHSESCQEIFKNKLEKKKNNKKSFKLEAALSHTIDDNHSKNFLQSVSDKKLTELATAEILNDSQNTNQMVLQSNKNSQQKKIHMTKEQDYDINEINYELVPVNDFGLAMLRGMGWNPSSGIGKNPRIISTTSPKLRPKGLGLGVKNESKSHTEAKSLNKL